MMATKICFLLLFLAIVEETNASPAFAPVKGLLIPHFFQNVLKSIFSLGYPFLPNVVEMNPNLGPGYVYVNRGFRSNARSLSPSDKW